MLKRLIVPIWCVLLLAGCQSAPEPVPFERHFQPVRTVTLSREILIDGSIRSLDVNEQGDLLVTDVGHAYLFDRTGALKHALDPSGCDPGARLRPAKARFRPDGNILMFNAGGGAFAFLFRPDGRCWKAAHDDIYHPASSTFIPNGEIYGHYMRPNADTNQIRRMTGEGQIRERFDVPASPYNNVDFRMGGRGAMIYANHRIYHTLPSSPVIYAYSREGTRVDVIDNPPSYYQPVTQHIPGRLENPMEAFPEHMRPIRRESTLNTALFRLDASKLLMQYQLNGGRVGIDVLDLDGRRLISGPITIDVRHPIKYAKSGKVYRVAQPDSMTRGQVPNPIIDVYYFKP